MVLFFKKKTKKNKGNFYLFQKTFRRTNKKTVKTMTLEQGFRVLMLRLLGPHSSRRRACLLP